MTPTSVTTSRNSWLAASGETALVAVVFIFVARVWVINQHVVFLVILAVLGGLIAWRPPKKINHSFFGYLPLGLMGVVFLIMASSSLWAPEFDRTFSYAVFSFLHFLIGVAVAVAFPLARIVGGLILAVAVIATYGLLLGIFDPGRGVTSGPIMGEFTNQSELSHFLGIAVVVAVGVLSRSDKVTIPRAVVIAGLGVYLVYLGYLTSFMAVAAALWVYGLVAIIRRLAPHLRGRGVAAGASLTAVLVSVLWVLRVPLQTMAGKTPDFSGRIPFWEHFWSLALANPWGGLGWGWLTWEQPGLQGEIRETFPNSPGIAPVQEYFPAHQGYIEFAYMIGIPAMILVISVLGLLLVRSFWAATDARLEPWLASSVPALIVYLSVFDLAATFHTRTIGMFFLGLLIVLASGLIRESRVSSPREGAG